MSVISIAVPLILLGIFIGWGFLIGTRNVIIRIVGVGISLLAAIGAVVIFKNLEFSDIAPLLRSLLPETEFGDAVIEFLKSADNLSDAMVSLCTALIAPIVFVVVFVIFAIVTWVIGWIVGLILMLVGSDGERKKRSPLVIIVCATVQAVLTVFVFVTPVVAYGDLFGEITGRSEIEFAESESISETLDEFGTSPVVAVYQTVGGKYICRWLTSFEINGQKSDLASEANAICRVVDDVTYLTDRKITEYGEEEGDVLVDLNEAVYDSLILPAIVGDIVYSATDAWLYREESFLGVSAPNLEETDADIFDGAFNQVLQIFHNDSRDHDALCADLEIITNAMVILADDGIFRLIGEDQEVLIEALIGGNTLRKLIAEIEKEPKFNVLVNEIANIGMRAIGSALNVTENAEEVFSDFTGSIAEELNLINSSNKSEEEKCDELTVKIKEAFAESGVETELDEETVKFYAQIIVEDFSDYSNITEEDVAEYFRAYTESQK